MTDKDFELMMERVQLLDNDGYFARHRELAPVIGVQAAWEQLESELPLGLKRYTSFHAFEAAKKREAEGTLPKEIRLKR